MDEYIRRSTVVNLLISVENRYNQNRNHENESAETLYRDLCDAEIYRDLCDAEIQIGKTPAADVASVVHGRWIMRGGHFHCSSCDAKAKWDREGGTGGWSHEYKQAKTPYCPVCGAKMDKEADDEQ